MRVFLLQVFVSDAKSIEHPGQRDWHAARHVVRDGHAQSG